jgi:oxygen-dependent protoporphyrinogen oxidase
LFHFSDIERPFLFLSQDEVLPVYRSDPSAKNRYIYINNTITKLPSSLTDGILYRTVKPFKRPLALAALQDLFTAAGERKEDESMHAFVSRRFGEDVADYIVDPMVRGICAGDSKEISAAAFVAGPLFKMEQVSREY